MPVERARAAGGGAGAREAVPSTRRPGRQRPGRVRTSRVRLLGLLLTTVLAPALLGLWAAAPAAADGYRYWSFWQRDGADWTYATEGPATARPGDGDTVGFRFAVSRDARDAVRPRGAADFATICADEPAGGDGKRVAVVLDFGTAQDAPVGERPPRPRTACARIAGDGTAADALARVAKPLRYDSSALLCAIAGYPKSGCGEQVRGDGNGDGQAASDRPSDAGDASSDSAGGGDGDGGGPSAGLIGGGIAVLALAAAALWQARRRRG
ncbi:SCO2322 family protein [Streptomyces sp. 796.1]|uniref:SCO2322 family protein n=1 Tax=Streptomyces sp. 796.1 TaxID=3163029 RepID=UPI0039C9F517